MTDQFYTNIDVANDCYKILKKYVNLDRYDIHLEPSAGSGSFYNIMDANKRYGIDMV